METRTLQAMVRHESQRQGYRVYGEDGRQVFKRILAGPRDGYPGYLREFSLEPGANTPYHQHAWSHLVYVLEGQGTVRLEGQDHPVQAGSVVHVEGGRTHGFFNQPGGPMRFLCLVPSDGDSYGPSD
jgi:quercetin dioxygenase-like cupin family protein